MRRGTAGEIAAWAREVPPRGEVALLIGPAPRTDVGEDDIRAALAAVGLEDGLKEAARIVAGKLGVARSLVYEIGLGMKARQP